MNVFLNIIYCCRDDNSLKNQIKCGISVPIKNNNSYSNEKIESKYNESSNIKSSEMNNTMTINNENNNNSNNCLSNIIEDNSNNQNINNINNNNLININSNINQSPNNINKSDTFVIQNKGISLSPRRIRLLMRYCSSFDLCSSSITNCSPLSPFLTEDFIYLILAHI